jgi:hypothetical protein
VQDCQAASHLSFFRRSPPSCGIIEGAALLGALLVGQFKIRKPAVCEIEQAVDAPVRAFAGGFADIGAVGQIPQPQGAGFGAKASMVRCSLASGA